MSKEQNGNAAKSQSRKDGKGAKTGAANPKFKIRNSYYCLLPHASRLLITLSALAITSAESSDRSVWLLSD